MSLVTMNRAQIWAWRMAILGVFFALWEWVSATRIIDPILIGKPSGIVDFFVREVFVTGSLFKDLGYTMLATIKYSLLATHRGSYAGFWVTGSIRRRGEPASR